MMPQDRHLQLSLVVLSALVVASPLAGAFTTVPAASSPPVIRIASASPSHTIHSVSVVPSSAGTSEIPIANWTQAPEAMAFDNATGELLVGAGTGATFNGSVAIVNTTAAAVTGWISNFSAPSGIAFDGLNGKVYVADSTPCCPSYVQVANATKGASSHNIALGTFNPGGITLDPDSGNLYVSELNGGAVTVINGSSDSVIKNISGSSIVYGNPGPAVYDSANKVLYVPVQSSNDITLIDTIHESIIGSIPIPGSLSPVAAALDPLNGFLYVAELATCYSCPGAVGVFDTSNNASVASIALPAAPTGLAFDSANSEVYVSEISPFFNFSASAVGSVDIINTTSNQVVAQVAAGVAPSSVLFDPANANLYVSNPGAGNLTVIPSNLVGYPVTINELGLPNGTVWSVNLSDGESFSSATSTLTFLEANGSYAGSASSVGLAYLASVGNFNVSGSAVEINITFAPNPSAIIFQESGLPRDIYWSVSLYGLTGSNNTTNNTSAYKTESTTSDNLAFIVPNGTYTFTVSGAYANGTNYQPVPANGSVVRAGSAVVVNLTFVPTILVEFLETGLPYYIAWEVTLNGTSGIASYGNGIYFWEPAGTYPFTVGSIPGYSASPGRGNVTVTNQRVYITIQFSVVTYPVTFSETGLPSGTEWGIRSAHGYNNTTANSETVNFINGTQFFLVSPVPGYLVTPSFEIFTETGAAMQVNLTFEPLLYNVTFSESGLPSGAGWSITVGSLTVNSTAASISLDLANGSFTFTASAGAFFTAHPSPGQFTVSGQASSEAITFRPVPLYPVTFSESGLGGTPNWSVTLNNHTGESNGGALSFDLPNGTYNFSVVAQQGFLVTPTNGTIVVDGQSVSLAIDFTAATPVKPEATLLGLPATEGYLLLGGIAGLLVGLGVGLALRRRRDPPAKPATQPWSEGPPPGQNP